MLTVLNTHTHTHDIIVIKIKNKEKREKTFGGDRCINGIDYGCGFMVAYIFPNSSSFTHKICINIYMSIILQLSG